MKKLVSAILVLSLIFTAGAAYAARPEVPANQGLQVRPSKERIADYKEQVAEKVYEIKLNMARMDGLRDEIKEVTGQIRQELIAKKQNAQLSEDQLNNFRLTLRQLNQQRMGLGLTVGQINRQREALTVRKINRQFGAAITNLEKIIDIQEERLELLESVLKDLKKLLADIRK